MMPAWIAVALAAIVVSFLLLVVLPAFWPGRRPLPTESDYTHHTPGYWQWYYGTKYLNPIRRPARGSGLDTLFRETRCPEGAPLSDARMMKIRAVGDLMVRRDIVPPLSPHLWDEVGDYLFAGDLVLGNFEFAVNEDWVIEKLLRYSVPASFAEPLVAPDGYGKFSLVSLANNHINDSLSKGIARTAEYLESRGVAFVGGNRTPGERDRVPIVEAQGIRVAVLGYTFSTNNIPLERGFEHGTNVVRFNALRDVDYDPSIVHRHVALARSSGADLVIALNHWGLEFEYYPPARLVRRAHDLLDAGVDIIIGHHPHILNPAEWYLTRDGRRGLCCYSLGNITSYALVMPFQRVAEIVDIEVEAAIDGEGRRVVRPRSATLTPTFFHTVKARTSSADNRIVALLGCARAIREGRAPAYLSALGRHRIVRLEREYRRLLVQPGFSYR